MKMIHSLTLIVVILCVLWVIGVIIVSFPLYALYSISKKDRDIQERLLKLFDSMSQFTLDIHKLSEAYGQIVVASLNSIESSLKSQTDEVYRFHKSLKRIISAYSIPNIPEV